MIIIIRALSPNKKRKKRKGQKKKKKGQRKKKKNEKRKAKKKERPKKRKKKKINKKGAMLLSLFPHLCFKVAPCSSYRESHILSLSYTSGNFSL